MGVGIEEIVPARGKCECIIIIQGDKSSARNNWIIWEAVDLRIVWLWNAQFLNVGVGSMQAIVSVRECVLRIKLRY